MHNISKPRRHSSQQSIANVIVVGSYHPNYIAEQQANREHVSHCHTKNIRELWSCADSLWNSIFCHKILQFFSYLQPVKKSGTKSVVQSTAIAIATIYAPVGSYIPQTLAGIEFNKIDYWKLLTHEIHTICVDLLVLKCKIVYCAKSACKTTILNWLWRHECVYLHPSGALRFWRHSWEKGKSEKKIAI